MSKSPSTTTYCPLMWTPGAFCCSRLPPAHHTQSDSPKTGDEVRWAEGVQGKKVVDVLRSKAKQRIGGKQTNEFFHFLSAPDWWHHLAVLSIHLQPPHPPKPAIFLSLSSLSLSSFCLPIFTVERESRKKPVYFSTGLLIYLDWE